MTPTLHRRAKPHRCECGQAKPLFARACRFCSERDCEFDVLDLLISEGFGDTAQENMPEIVAWARKRVGKVNVADKTMVAIEFIKVWGHPTRNEIYGPPQQVRVSEWVAHNLCDGESPYAKRISEE